MVIRSARPRGIAVSLALVLALPLAGCGGGGGGGGGGGTDTGAVSMEIGPAGNAGNPLESIAGTIAGARLEVPAGALAATHTVTLALGTDIGEPGFLSAGPAVAATPDGLAFALDATLRVPYDLSGFAPGHDAEVTVLKKDGTGAVVALGAPALSGNDTVEVAITSFSTFQAVLPQPPLDLTGTWISVTVDLTPVAPQDARGVDLRLVGITQSATTLDVDMDLNELDDLGAPKLLAGTVFVTIHQLEGAWAESGGTLTQTTTLDAINDEIAQGVMGWTFDDGVIQTAGSAEVFLTRRTTATPDFDATGTWDVNYTGNTSQPPGFEEPDAVVRATITQVGAAVTVDVGDGNPFTGEVSGQTYVLARSYEDTGGTKTEMLTLMLSDADTIAPGGQYVWWWVDAAQQIRGGAMVDGVRVP